MVFFGWILVTIWNYFPAESGVFAQKMAFFAWTLLQGLAGWQFTDWVAKWTHENNQTFLIQVFWSSG